MNLVYLTAQKVSKEAFGKSRMLPKTTNVIISQGRTIKGAINSIVKQLLVKHNVFQGFELLCPNLNPLGGAVTTIVKNSNFITRSLDVVKYYEIEGARNADINWRERDEHIRSS